MVLSRRRYGKSRFAFVSFSFPTPAFFSALHILPPTPSPVCRSTLRFPHLNPLFPPLFLPLLCLCLKGDDSLSGSVARASLQARGITIVDFPLPDTAPPPLLPMEDGKGTATGAALPAAARLELAAAATAVSRELYRRGMLCAAWEVGPAMASAAIEGGHIQRALVRRRPGAGGAGGEGAAAAATTTGGPVGTGSDGGGGGLEERSGCGVEAGDVSREEERAALQMMRRLSGSEGARVRRGGGVFPRVGGADSCIEVLLPAAGIDPPASA